MTHPALQAVRCPRLRNKGGRHDTLCNALVIPGKDYAFCHKCSAFFRIIRVPGKPLKLIDIDKDEIRFMWLLLEYQNIS
jgi:hypothetical protein